MAKKKKRTRLAQPTAVPPKSPPPKLSRFVKTAYGKIIATGAVLAGVWGAYETISKVRSEYERTFAAVDAIADDFSLPFAVKNPSTWFSFTDLRWHCTALSIEAVGGGRLTNSVVGAGKATTISPGESKNFSCGTSGPFRFFVRAKMEIKIDYSTVFGTRSKVVNFDWVSGKWIKGEIVR